jgi:predicted nucleotide-binding protein
MESIRMIACHHVLREAFHHLAAQGKILQRELQNERSGHANRHLQFTEVLQDHVKALATAKMAFVRDETDIPPLLGKLDTLLRKLQENIIEPLKKAAGFEARRQLGQAQSEIKAIIDTDPYTPILQEARKGREEVQTLQDAAVQKCRELQEPAALPQRVRVFLGCARERLALANAIQQPLLNRGIELEIWSSSTLFEGGGTIIEALEKAMRHCQFGIFIYTPDDHVSRRARLVATPGNPVPAPRGNVLLELGMFVGRHTRFRARILCPRGMKVITDLEGLLPIEYDPNLNKTALGEYLAEKIASAIENVRRDGHAGSNSHSASQLPHP